MDGRKLQYIRVSDESAILKRGVTEMMLKGPEVHPILEALLPLLEGTRKPVQIIETFAEEMRPEVASLLDQMFRRRLISAEAETEPLSMASLQASFWSTMGDRANQSADRLRRASVVVVGVTLISRALVRNLLESEVGSVTLVDHPLLNNELAPPLIDVPSDSRLRRVPELPPEDELSSASLICATCDAGLAESLLDIGRTALRVERPFLPVWLQDLIAYAGPLTFPYETACLHCFRLRTDSNHPNFQAAEAIRRHYSSNPQTVPATGLIPPIPAMIGDLAAMEALKFLAGYPPCDLAARTIELNLVAFSASVRRILKVPRCPDCSDVMRRASRAILIGPLVPYSE